VSVHQRVTVRPASDYAALCFHGLAHVPLLGPERLQDLRYQAHARRTLPAAAIEPLATDGPAIATALGDAAIAAQWLPRLHPDIGSFLATSAVELSCLEGAHVPALAALRAHRCDGLEWLRTDLLLIAEAFAAHTPTLDVEARELEAYAKELAHLGLPERFEIAPSLGPRGRAYPDAIIVGAPQPWWCIDDIDRAIPLVLSIHEHAVRRAASDHVSSEWSALRSVARSLRSSPLAAPHQRWTASLDLDALLGPLARAHRITALDAEALRAHPDERAERLGSI